ncbi:MAG TPA: DUF2255 family protein [Candidatus Binataceae bacterium]|jgi:hypothetical protein|nr:DUF2255 family protein [Candidatus Binataceae bacterium]
MKSWTRDELSKLAAAEEIAIAPLGRDGRPRKPVTVWIVRLGDDLYVRSAYGPDSGWFRGARRRGEGRIRAGEMAKEVSFVEADPELTDAIDAAYRAKYRSQGAQYVNMMVSSKARSAALKVLPR